ncbi:MAG: mechanosensitive ion channel [Myxococcales bacterium]|nr:mechanosensitive ion channel [Myxococcales bacterium]
MPEYINDNLSQIIPYLTESVGTFLFSSLGGIFFLLVGFAFAGWARKLVRRIADRSKLDTTLSTFLASAIRYAIIAMTILSALSLFGIETTSFAAVIGAAGLAIGLALQGTLGNLASGLLLIGFRPFKVGDFIRTNGESGTVEEIQLFSTILRTVDNRAIIIPNGPVFNNNIENVTAKPQRRVDITVGVDYAANLQQTRDVLCSVYTDVENILTVSTGAPADPVVVLTELGSSSVDWALRVWCPADKYWPIREKLLERIKNKLDEANIGIPFPQMEVHLASPPNRTTIAAAN